MNKNKYINVSDKIIKGSGAKLSRNADTLLTNIEGVALIMALIVTLLVFLLVMSTLYVITQSTGISGAGKRYATASEAADGAAEVVKEGIRKVWQKEPLPSILIDTCFGQTYNFKSAAETKNTPCITTMTLPSTIISKYSATVSVEYLFTLGQAGMRITFPPKSVGGFSGVATYYRITTVVAGPNNTSAENSVLYRYTE